MTTCFSSPLGEIRSHYPPSEGVCIDHASALVEIDLERMWHNYCAVKDSVQGASVGAVVKANAYGLGMVPVSHFLFERGVKDFFVSTVEEALVLRCYLPDASIIIFNGVWPEAMPGVAASNCIPVLSTLEQVKAWNKLAHQQERTLPVWLQVDTGFVRLGLNEKDCQTLADNPHLMERLSLKYVMSHLACGYDTLDTYNAVQKDKFDHMASYFPGAQKSLGNSAAPLLGKGYFYDMIRMGRFLYGSTYNLPDPFCKKLQPVVRLSSRVLQITEIPQGQSVGYDRTFVAPHPMRLATVSLGYADGYTRALSNRGYGFFKNYQLPIVGVVSMDLAVVDITHVPLGLIHPGIWINFLNEKVTIDTLAPLAGTHTWEILTQIGERPTYLYHEWGKKKER
jgi:alanine racemase